MALASPPIGGYIFFFLSPLRRRHHFALGLFAALIRYSSFIMPSAPREGGANQSRDTTRSGYGDCLPVRVTVCPYSLVTISPDNYCVIQL